MTASACALMLMTGLLVSLQPLGPPPDEAGPDAASVESPFQPISIARPTEPVSVRGMLSVSIAGMHRQQPIIAWYRPSPTPEVLIQLGRFTIHGVEHEDSSTVTVVHAADRASYVQARSVGPLGLSGFDRVVPPIPLPMLAAWLDGGAATLPGAPAVAWNEPVTLASGGSRWIGRTPDGPAIAIAGPEGLRSWRQSTTLNGRPATIDLAFEYTVPPSDQWGIDLEGRRRVASLAGLQPAESAIERFQPMPALPLFAMDRAAWSPPTIGVEEDQSAVEPFPVLLLVRATSPHGLTTEIADRVQEAVQVAQQRIEREQRTRREAGDGVMPIGLRPTIVLVFSLSEFSLESLSEARSRFPDDAQVVWSASPAATIDRFAPGAEAALVVVDGYRRLVSVMDPARADLVDALVDVVTQEAWLEGARGRNTELDDSSGS